MLQLEKLNYYELPLDIDTDISSISPRTLEVLGTHATSPSHTETARELLIKPGTVKDHLESARTALGAINTTHAITIGYANKILVPAFK